MKVIGIAASLLLAAATTAGCQETCPQPRIVQLRASDGVSLKATYFAAAKRGPAVLLLHQNTRARKSWEGVAQELSAAGVNALTLDLRGFGESGTPVAKLTAAERDKLTHAWPLDVDAALRFLDSQPDVNHKLIGVGGSGWLGVLCSVEAARRTDAINSLVLMSGETFRDGLQFLHQPSHLPELFVFSDDDEYPPTQDAMKLLYVTSSSSSKQLVHYSAAENAPWRWYETPFAESDGKVHARGGHGTDMFQVHSELPGLIVHWFVTTLIKTPGRAPVDGLAAAAILNQLQTPGGAAQVMQQLLEARRADPNSQLWPEVDADIIGGDFQRSGDIHDAIEVFKVNMIAYADSADAHSNLASAYLADGKEDLARKYAQSALSLFESRQAPVSSWSDTDERRAEVRRGIEEVLQKAAARATPHSSNAPGTVFRDCSECPEMVILPAGHFVMGSSEAEKAWAAAHGGSPEAVSDEAPQHEVTLPAFALGRYDVTRAEYTAFVSATGHPLGEGCGHGRAIFKWEKDANLTWKDPGFVQTDRDPVVCVNWHDAQAYVAWLNTRSGHAGAYHLPSESEWEYAARAGTATRFYWGDADGAAAVHAWFNADSGCQNIKGLFCEGGQTHPVGMKPPNAFGLYDMAGNVWQWTQDCYDNSYAGVPADGRANETASTDPKANDAQAKCLRVDRGGSWMFPAWLLRPATRERNPADYRNTIMGFRVARTLP